MLRISLLATFLFLSSSSHADWLADAVQAASGASNPQSKSAWIDFEPPSRLFRGEIPAEGWHAFDEEDALGSIVRIYGPEHDSGALRAVLSVRLIDRESPNFRPAKEAIDDMRRASPGRTISSAQPLRVTAGLARIFEITETRRLPLEEAPSAPMDIHQYVAVIPRGEAYYLIRLISAREDYLDYRGDFIRFLKSFRLFGAR